MPVSITVNGKRHSVDADGETPLLYVLRNDLQLKGARYGCGLGQCGACTVVIDGKAVQSCDVPLSAVADKAITTIEGIGSTERPHVLQQAFLAEQAAQCGYCTTGIIMSAYALLARAPRPTEAEIRAALAGNLCRCGTHARVLRAIKRAAGSGS
jgi:aerobic-type carbon monoxide dehydrogenase small subunit (CoxS/CutS family)